MIRAMSGSTLILGLSKENIKRLKANMPIHVSLAEIGLNNDCLIVYGETEQDIIDMFNTEHAQPPKKPT